MEFRGPAGLLLLVAAMICAVPLGITALIIEYKKWRVRITMADGFGPAPPDLSSASPPSPAPTDGPSSAEEARQDWLALVRQEREAMYRYMREAYPSPSPPPS
jgi:hypothetical protein